MAKQKTHKAFSSRVKVTGSGKVLKRTAGQDHFNGGESGKTTRNKRRDKNMSSTHKRAIKTLMPNG
jgi:large subunit ribosomal protein L35